MFNLEKSLDLKWYFRYSIINYVINYGFVFNVKVKMYNIKQQDGLC